MQKHGIVRVGDEAIGSRLQGGGPGASVFDDVRLARFAGSTCVWRISPGVEIHSGFGVWFGAEDLGFETTKIKIAVEGQVPHSKAHDSTLQEIQVNVGSLCAH